MSEDGWEAWPTVLGKWNDFSFKHVHFEILVRFLSKELKEKE